MDENLYVIVVSCSSISARLKSSKCNNVICAVYEDAVMSEIYVRKRFVSFRIEKYDLEHRETCRRILVVNDDEMDTMIRNNPGHISRSILERLSISHMRFGKHLKIPGYDNRYKV